MDGSSNIDANVSIGSIFAIWNRKSKLKTKSVPEDYLRNGNDILASGYCLYGSSVHFLLALPNHVAGFTLDPALGEFILTHDKITLPTKP